MKIVLSRKYLAASLVLFAAMVFIALFVRDGFIRWHFGDILVTLFLCCFIRAFIGKKGTWLPLGVFVFAAMVEIGQLFNLVELLGLEGVRIAEIVIGATFDIWDIVMYGIGCCIFYVIDKKAGDAL